MTASSRRLTFAGSITAEFLKASRVDHVEEVRLQVLAHPVDDRRVEAHLRPAPDDLGRHERPERVADDPLRVASADLAAHRDREGVADDPVVHEGRADLDPVDHRVAVVVAQQGRQYGVVGEGVQVLVEPVEPAERRMRRVARDVALAEQPLGEPARREARVQQPVAARHAELRRALRKHLAVQLRDLVARDVAAHRRLEQLVRVADEELVGPVSVEGDDHPARAHRAVELDHGNRAGDVELLELVEVPVELVDRPRGIDRHEGRAQAVLVDHPFSA
ncbi:MAG: hypothetical protein M5U08_02570 [Burkholderiales bacterium]|nr:hypothetical protein [Burkholderiales bacterium]